MKRPVIIMLLSLLFVSGSVNAQFDRQLPSKKDAAQWDADYSVGIFGGLSATRWFHINNAHMNYGYQPYSTIHLAFDTTCLQSLLNNALAGISVERKLGDYHAVGLDVAFANRNTRLSYHYSRPDTLGVNSKVFADNNIQYSELFIQVPFTQYMTSASKAVRPYVFVAPRVTIPLFGGIQTNSVTYPETSTGYLIDMNDNHVPNQDEVAQIPVDSIEFSGKNMRRWNIGAVLGAGVQCRIPFGDYYHMTMKLDASCHLGLLNTFSKYERGKAFKKDENGDYILDAEGNRIPDPAINAVTGQPIDPNVLGKRYISNATVKLTLMFPIKRVPKDACVSWGEYD